MAISAPPRPATEQLDAARQFDFWLGEWDCSWGDGGRGTNSVYLDLDGKVVVESFDARPSLDYQAISYSVYDLAERCWRQTRVDSDGAYLVLAGGLELRGMELRGGAGGTDARVRWLDVEPRSLTWSYETSDDAGGTWTPARTIHYRRVL